jgi:hypothetical protein
MLRISFKLITFITILTASSAMAYDPQDYATTEKATFDALVKANDELIGAGTPHKSALEAYRGAVNEYLLSLDIPSPSKDLKQKNILKQK